jgi:hypothetical protein
MKFYVAEKQGLFGAVRLWESFTTEAAARTEALEFAARVSYDKSRTIGLAWQGERGLVFSPV